MEGFFMKKLALMAIVVLSCAVPTYPVEPEQIALGIGGGITTIVGLAATAGGVGLLGICGLVAYGIRNKPDAGSVWTVLAVGVTAGAILTVGGLGANAVGALALYGAYVGNTKKA